MKKYFVLAIAVLGLMACDKNNGQQGGVQGTDPSSIAKENLVAYLPFDGAATETITKTEPTTVGNGVAYTAGRRGQALQGAENGYLLYDLPNLGKSLKGFTVACWLNEPVRNDAPVPSFLQLLSDDFWGDLCFVTDRRPDDVIAPKLFFRTYVDGAAAGDRWLTTDGMLEDNYVWGTAFTANAWIHVAFAYDATTSELHAYVNGQCVDPTVENEAGEKVYNPACVNFSGEALGELNITSTQLLVNGWKQKVLDGAEDPWMGWMEGQLDELRIYNKGLSAAEISDLFKAEVSQVK